MAGSFERFINRRGTFLISAIILLAFTLRAGNALLVGDSPEKWRGDTAQYVDLADSILEGRGFAFSPRAFEERLIIYARPEGRPTSFRAPGFSFFLAVIFKLFNHSIMAAMIVQCILSALSVWLIYLAGCEMLGRKTAVIAAGIAAVYPAFFVFHLYGASHIHPEVPFIFGLSLLLLFLYRTARAPSLRNSVITGIILAMVMYIREAATVLPVFAVALLVLVKYHPLKKRLVSAGIVSLTFIILIAPWIIRNYRVHGAPVWSTFTGEVLWQSNNPGSQGGWDLFLEGNRYTPEKMRGRSESEIRRAKRKEYSDQLKGLSEMEINRVRFKQATDYLRNNIDRVPKLFLRKVLMLWNVYDEEYRISYGIIFFLFIWGVVLLWKVPAKRDIFAFLFLYIIYFNILTMIFHGKPRYRLAFEANLILFASVAVAYILENWRDVRYKIASFLIVGVNIVLGLNSQRVLAVLRKGFEALNMR